MTHAEFKYLIGGDSRNRPMDSRAVMARLPQTVKRHFLESELKTADDLIVEYMDYGTGDMEHSASRLKLVWLLERLQESVL